MSNSASCHGVERLPCSSVGCSLGRLAAGRKVEAGVLRCVRDGC